MMSEAGFARAQLISKDIGDEIFAFAAEIYPICRSITGDGVRETLARIKAHIPIDVHAVPTGTAVFDWTIPREWNIRDAYIKNGKGEKIVDFSRSNLHVMSYSVPIRARLSLAELKRHLYTLPDQPDVIPYRTSYYAEDWAFCISHRLLEGLREETYDVLIDSTLQDGYLFYGEYLHRGLTDEEFLLSAHVCHPSLANDNCSGIALLTQLAKRMSGLTTRYSYRFLFAPGTIGAITWLARNEAGAKRIKHGLVVSMVGDEGGPTYKRSRRGNAAIDRAVIHALRHAAPSATVLDFSPYGYDERQFCSPGFNLPVGLLQRSQYGKVPQYHTSADDLGFIAPEHLASSYRLVVDTLGIVEGDLVFRNTRPRCEPQLGRRGLYKTVTGDSKAAEVNMAMLWVLNLSDGEHSLLDIAERAGLPFDVIETAAMRLKQHGLLCRQPVCSLGSDRVDRGARCRSRDQFGAAGPAATRNPKHP
jgi:aminopeptidase-like protein